MAKLFSYIIGVFLLAIMLSCNTIKNAKTEQVHIYGNCGMCKKTIENAGNKKNEAKVNWNKDTKIADLTYDTTKTNQNEILKRIAKAGYDSENFLAPNEVYNNLPKCCHYDRNPKAVFNNTTAPTKEVTDNITTTSVEHKDTVKETTYSVNTNQIKDVMNSYFLLKDVLVKSDSKQANTKASLLEKSIDAVDMKTLSNEEHKVWMKVNAQLKSNAKKIADTKDVAQQRTAFVQLSEDMYALAKTAKLEAPVYYQHCPMYNDGQGANWLSQEKSIKNPYYGSQMLNCGNVQETIK